MPPKGAKARGTSGGPAGHRRASPGPAAKAKQPPPAVDPALRGELDRLLDATFAFYDEDQDGAIERVELLNGEEKRRGQLGFGPSERKKAIAWFKEAGAEGTPVDGMFLSKDKWLPAFTKAAAEEAVADAGANIAVLIAWLKEHYAICFEAAKPTGGGEASAAGAGDDAPATREPPSYPITIPLKELSDRIKEAALFDKTVLVLASGLTEVETFMTYQFSATVDAKMLLNEVLIKKSMSKEEGQQKARETFVSGMNSHGFTKAVHVRMANTAFNWVTFCGDRCPPELFSKRLMTIDEAHRQDFFDEGHKFTLSVDDRWKEYYVVITSTFDEAAAKEHLSGALPYFDEMAVLIVDPGSVAK